MEDAPFLGEIPTNLTVSEFLIPNLKVTPGRTMQHILNVFSVYHRMKVIVQKYLPIVGIK